MANKTAERKGNCDSAEAASRVPCSASCVHRSSASQSDCDPAPPLFTLHSHSRSPALYSSSNPNGWSDIELATFRKLLCLCGPDSCEIAQLLGSRTCIEVHRLIQIEAANAAEAEQSPSSEEENEEESGNTSAASASASASASSSLQYPKRSGRRKRRRLSAAKSSKSKARTDRGLPIQFYPCDHDGPCSVESNCSCSAGNRQCEKSCGCGPLCSLQFPGCSCKPGSGRCQTRLCACFAANRECDPDKCFTCDASVNALPSDKLEPVKLAALQTDDERFCLNRPLQLGLRKRLFIARSSVHGWGAFIVDSAKKGELITEYTGELISQDEADRRGKIYDRLNRSYLFNLNEEYVVDAARKGNEIRYANHSENPNCYSRVMNVNGDHRIGIYARRKIRPGEELFFHYQHEHAGSEPEWFMEAKGKGHGAGGANASGATAGDSGAEEADSDQAVEAEPPRRQTAKKNS